MPIVVKHLKNHRWHYSFIFLQLAKMRGIPFSKIHVRGWPLSTANVWNYTKLLSGSFIFGHS